MHSRFNPNSWIVKILCMLFLLCMWEWCYADSASFEYT